jgi:hypothetical protein
MVISRLTTAEPARYFGDFLIAPILLLKEYNIG